MTFTLEADTAPKKARPTDEIFPVGEDGAIIREGKIPVWSSKHGRAKSFRINGQLYVQFPVRLRLE